VTNQKDTIRPQLWEDNVSPDERVQAPRARRVSQPLPAVGRAAAAGVLPGMPLDLDDRDFGDPEDDDLRPRFRSRSSFEEPRAPWYRPRSKAGRLFLGLGAVLVLGGVTAGGLLLKRTLERDSHYRIAGTENIEATGLNEIPRAQMLPVFGEDIGRNIFFVPLDLRRRQLEQIPWVKRATVMRLLPDRIRVSIVEREPVAFSRIGNRIGLVDADGVLLSMSAASMARHHYSFPVLTGIDPGDPSEARRARMAVYLRLMSDLDSTGQHYSQQISEIDLTDPEDARVLMPEQGSDILAHFGEDHFLERYRRYKAHIAEWRQQYPHLASVDLRYDEQVVLDMGSGAISSQPDSSAVQKPGAGQPAIETPQQEATAAKSGQPLPGAEPSGATQKKKIAAQQKKRAQMRRAALAAARHNAPAARRRGATQKSPGPSTLAQSG
jgi:cell division protein FtsQ